MRPPVTCKRDMYTRLMRGEFGNHTPQWFSYVDWVKRPYSDCVYRLWGLRHSGKARGQARLNVPTEEVGRTLAREFRDGFSISPMVDEWTTLRCELVDLPGGLNLRYVAHRNTIPWHYALAEFGKSIDGCRVWPFLAGFLRDNDLDMVRELVLNHPGHTIEFTNCNRCVGVFPNHRVVVWEVRCEGGRYEGW